ncbi:MAG: sugar phosphate isomerase/epimerase [Burkholderiales bacterium]|jgi:sugar phosphate isomerase/epimerase|nr:sugar phosphate isomerase/epimerase [Burkholderiales bacterium]
MIQSNFSLDPASLPGSLLVKLQQVRAAGFDQIMLWGSDLANHPGGYDEAVRLVRASALRITGMQLLRDYEGRSPARHQYKLDIAKETLKLCKAVGAPMLVVTSSTEEPAPDAQSDLHDLRKLANLGVPFNVRIGYKAVPWAHSVRSASDAWSVVADVDHENFHLVLDTLHMLMTDADLSLLDDVDPNRIALVQLADFSEAAMVTDPDRRAAANHSRVFPGDGGHSTRLTEMVRAIDRIGYRGDYSFLVMNDDYRQLPASVVTDHARRSASWLTNQVLRRALQPRLPPSLRDA